MSIAHCSAGSYQGCNARKVISEVYTSFVLQCTLSGGNLNIRRMSRPDMGSIFHIKNQWNILVIGNYYVNYQNYQNLMLLTSLDTKRTLLLFTNSAQRELVSEYTRPQLTFLALHPWFILWSWVFLANFSISDKFMHSVQFFIHSLAEHSFGRLMFSVVFYPFINRT